MLITEYIKEDGSLDVGSINKLPIEEYMQEIGKLPQAQIDESIDEFIENF